MTTPRRFGRYVLLRSAGAGEFGRVDIALTGTPAHPRVCVLKRLRTHAGTDAELNARFRREAAIALKLSHGAIAQTVDVTEVDGRLCLLQEFVEGVTLHRLQEQIDPGRLPLPIALHIAMEVSRALSYAHSQGVVHRDVTPDNIMVAWHGEVKLIDFGIAKTAGSDLTQVGVAIGKKMYTAPEVLAGAAATSKADVYSLGVVLWQMLSGKHSLGAAIDPSTLNAEVPPALGALTLQALAPDPRARVESADAIFEALERLRPAGEMPERALARFCERYFHFKEDIEILRQQVDAARDLLPDPSSPPAGLDTTNKISLSRRSWARPVALGLGLGAALLAAGVTLKYTASREALGPTTATAPLGSATPQTPETRGEELSGPARGAPALEPPRADLAFRAAPEEAEVPERLPAARPMGRAQRSGGRDARHASSVAPLPLSATPTPQPLAAPEELPQLTMEQRIAELEARALQQKDQGELPGALDSAREAIRLGGGTKAALLLAALLLRAGEAGQAQPLVDRVLAVDPANREALRLKRALAEGDIR